MALRAALLRLFIAPRRFYIQAPFLVRQSHTTASCVGMIEEQTLPFYHERRYYPVKIGQTFRNKYRIIAKLGYGAYSTVWLAWDKMSSQYTTLKICVETRDAEASPIWNEINMLRRLKKYADEFDRPGPCFTRLARDIFEINGPYGRHVCISFKAQGASLRTMQEIFPNAQLPRLLVRSLIHRLFFSVNWLHATCGVVHTGMYRSQASSILCFILAHIEAQTFHL